MTVLPSWSVLICEGYDGRLLGSANGVDNVARAALDFRQKQTTHPIDQMLACVDHDGPAGHPPRQHALPCAVARWSTDDPAGTLWLADQQDLARVICSALIRAYPARAADVANWLEREPLGEKPNGKSYAFAQLAKWYPGTTEAGLPNRVLGDPAIREHLRGILERNGVLGQLQKFGS